MLDYAANRIIPPVEFIYILAIVAFFGCICEGTIATMATNARNIRTLSAKGAANKAVTGYADLEPERYASWATDSSTGFLTSDRPEAFNADKKLVVLNYMATKPMSVQGACNLVGITRSTYHRHKHADKAFCEAINKIVDERLDDIEEAGMQYALEKENSADRKFILAAHRPEVYNKNLALNQGPQLVISFNGVTVDGYTRKQKILDAEIVGDAGSETSEQTNITHLNTPELAPQPIDPHTNGNSDDEKR